MAKTSNATNATRALAGHNASRVKTATRSLTGTRWNSSPAPLPLHLRLVASQRYTAFALKNLAAESETSAKRLQLPANRAWISWPRIKPSRKVQIFTYLYTHTHTHMWVACMCLLFISFAEQPKLLNNDSNICFNVTTLYGTMLIHVHACPCNVYVHRYIYCKSMCRVSLLVEHDSEQM